MARAKGGGSIRMDVEGNAEQELRKAKEAVEKFTKKMDASAKAAERHNVESKKLKEQIKKLKEESAAAAKKIKEMKKEQTAAAKSSAALKKSVLAAGAALLAAKLVVVDSVKAYAELDASHGRLERSLKKAGATAEDLAASHELIRKNMQATGFGIQEQNDALKTLADSTQDVTLAQGDLNLAINIASGDNKDLAQVTDVLSKARKGNVSAMEDLAHFTKGEIEDLAAIKDESLRAEIAMGKLKRTYGGAAEETHGLSEDMKTLDGNMKLVSTSTGQYVIALGKMVGVITTGEGDQTWFDVFAKDTKSWADEMSAGVDTMRDYIDAFTELAAKNASARRGGVLGLGFDLATGKLGEDADRRATLRQRAAVAAKGTRGVRTFGEGGDDASGRAGVPDIGLDTAATFKKREEDKTKTKAAEDKKRTTSRKKEIDEVRLYEDEARLDRESAEETAKLRKQHAHETELLQIRATADAEAFTEARREESRAADKKYLNDKREREETLNKVRFDGALSAVDGILMIADVAGASEAKVGTMRGLMEIAIGTSEALGFLTGGVAANPVSAAGHFKNAAVFFSVAAMGGGGGGGASKSAGSAGAPAASTQLNTEQLNTTTRQASIVNNFDYSRSVGVGPQARRELAAEVSRGQMSVLGSSEVF